MALQLRKDDEVRLYAEVALLIRTLADAWDPGIGGESNPEQPVAKSLLKEASRISRELDKYLVVT